MVCSKVSKPSRVADRKSATDDECAKARAYRDQLRATKPKRSEPETRLSLDEAPDLVRRMKEQGLCRGPDEATPIKKDGHEVTQQQFGVRSQWMDVTPAKARLWLGNNFRNRPVSEDVIAAYARDMTNRVWVATHQGIAFNDRDELIDGQHRLHAIVRSGVTVRMMVTFGLPSKIDGREMTTMDAVDRGRTRSVADQLKIQHGMKDGSLIASICANIGSICFGERTRRLSVGQTLDIYRAFEQPVHWVIAHRSKEHGLRMTGVLAAFAFAIATEPDFQKGSGCVSGKITLMFERLMDGDGIAEGSAMARLRDFLIGDEAKLLTRGTDRGLAELVLEAIRLELRGRPVAKLEMSQEGAQHFRGLQKERVAKVAAIFALPKQ